jgi:2-polyprenyl-3-methyl-5-hydroxy-6-metoxy-1,4-benzoquinol methylase
MARLGFALWSLKARFRDQNQGCPYCGSILHTRLQRKWLLIQARKCAYCGLIFRWPTDDPRKARDFYEQQYRSGITTDVPSRDEIANLRANGFRNSRFDKYYYVDLVKEVRPAPARVLDYGASWGYLAYQLQFSGYEVEGFELDRLRAEYGEKELKIPIHSSWDDLKAKSLPRFDIVFAAHCLEHVYDLSEIFDRFAGSLVRGGKLVVVVPNGGGRDARRLGVRWGPFLGETHTIAFTSEWFRQNLGRHGFKPTALFSFSKEGKDWNCDGDNLVFIAELAGTDGHGLS